MRIVIDIDGDQVRVQRVTGDEPLMAVAAPADLLARAAAMGAESAGYARIPGAALTAAVGVGPEPGDAGRAPRPAAARPKRPAKAARRKR